MTDQEINITIAEACGWKTPPDCARLPKHKWWNPADGCCYDTVPNYCHDLNAMHEAEKILRQNQFHYIDYPRRLFNVVSRCDLKDGLGYFTFNFINATAHQRAEAFLRTIGKWKD